MSSRSSLTVRVSGIIPKSESTETLKQQFQQFADGEPKWTWIRRSLAKPLGPLLVSLAQQGDTETGIIALPSKNAKKRVLKRSQTADDTFSGLTVLHSAREPDLDICAVHGLNGNAFDTFAWDGRQMWLRDFLPAPRDLYPGVSRTRVMTYGYSSLLRDNKNTAGLDDWSMDLIEKVSAARRSPSERARPIIFVCHSMGGIVARQAMIRLGMIPSEGLKLEHCGLLFLSTPHSGTTEADFNDILLLCGKGAGISRGQTFNQLLSSFNETSVNAKEQFGALKTVPPVECLYETQKTSFGPINRVIVSPDSAGLIDRAKPMLNVNHRTICKFPNMSDQGYLQVLGCLESIRRRIVASQIQQQGLDNTPPAGTTRAEGIRGGTAVGGNATSNDPDGEARGGSASGGDINASSHTYSGDFPLMGGTGTGGYAVGKRAIGGSAAGGSVRLG